jgi:hypothetical protein
MLSTDAVKSKPGKRIVDFRFVYASEMQIALVPLHGIIDTVYIAMIRL